MDSRCSRLQHFLLLGSQHFVLRGSRCIRVKETGFKYVGVPVFFAKMVDITFRSHWTSQNFKHPDVHLRVLAARPTHFLLMFQLYKWAPGPCLIPTTWRGRSSDICRSFPAVGSGQNGSQWWHRTADAGWPNFNKAPLRPSPGPNQIVSVISLDTYPERSSVATYISGKH